jgi:DNA-binding response OmpR family regulator
MIKLVDEVTPLHLTEVEGRVALICIDDQTLSERVAQMINELGFHVIIAQKPSSTISKLEDHHCDLIILDENYGLSESAENPILIHLQCLPMVARRRTFLCLLSEKTPTLDQMAAFRAGANLIINSRDVEKVPLILDRILRDYQTFYAVLENELAKRGASLI